MRKESAFTINRLPITQARVNLGQVARRVHVGGEYFILEKDGIPVIGIMDADELEDYLELKNARIKRQIKGSNADIAAGRVRSASALLAKPVRDAARPATANRRRTQK